MRFDTLLDAVANAYRSGYRFDYVYTDRWGSQELMFCRAGGWKYAIAIQKNGRCKVATF